MLAAIVCGILTGARGYKAIAQWARAQHATIGPWLGFQRRPPCANCFRNLLLALDPEVLEAVLCEWMQAVLGKPLPKTLPSVSLDGKTLCNTLSAHERNVHLLSFFDQSVGGVLGQQAVDPTTNEAKAALGFLKAVVLEGQLIGPIPVAAALLPDPFQLTLSSCFQVGAGATAALDPFHTSFWPAAALTPAPVLKNTCKSSRFGLPGSTDAGPHGPLCDAVRVPGVTRRGVVVLLPVGAKKDGRV
jgi:hypothetical protein